MKQVTSKMTIWLEICLFLPAVVSLPGQTLNQNDTTLIISPTKNIQTTKKPQAFLNITQQEPKPNENTKNLLNDTFAEFAKRWKSLLIHGYPRAVPVMQRDLGTGRQYLKIDLQNETDCHLHPLPTSKNVTIYEKVLELISHGKRLITFTIHFPEYLIHPLKVNMSNNYKPYKWFRTYDTHAYTLLALPFNYKIISMYTLWFGTAELEVEVVDYPMGCFPKLSTEDKLYVTMDLVSKDFKLDHGSHNEMHGEDPHVCHQIIKVSDSQGHFSYRCCRRREEDGELECAPYEDSTWLSGLFIVLIVVDILAFLFGPQFIDHTIFSEELHVKPYEVELDPPIDGTMLLEYSSSPVNTGSGTLIELDAQSRHDANISITKLLLKVEHKSLMSARRVPVGFFKFIYYNVFQCGMRKSEPFKSCFKSPIFWPQSDKGDTPNRKFFGPVWKDLMISLGNLLMLLCLPIPLYIRLVIYYTYESDEINARHQAINDLGITMSAQYDLFYLLTPTHPFYQTIYIIIIVSIIFLLILRQIDIAKFDNIIVETFRDFRGIKKFETFRLFFTHLLLPFETCGIYGLFFAPFYWVAMVLASFVVIIVYTVPTVYLTFRFLISDRPDFIKQMQCKRFNFSWCPKSKMIQKLSQSPDWDGECSSNDTSEDKEKSDENNAERSSFPRHISPDDTNQPNTNAERCLFLHRVSPDDTIQPNANAERCLFLHRISPDDTIHPKTNVKDFVESDEKDDETTYHVIMADTNKSKSTQKNGYIRGILFHICVAISCVMLMLCTLLLFSEVVGFFVEVAVFSFMGAIVNASSAGKFIMVSLTLVLYCVSIFRNFHGSYENLNRHIFELLTKKLDDKIEEVTDKPADQQNDTAYRYLNDEEIKRLGGKEVNSTFKKIQESLVWKCKGLVLFVDAHDTPRIPKKFFYKACEIPVSGCPGKVIVNLLKTLRQVVFMVLFLGFVLWVVILFHNVYTLTTTQQLLFTLSGSFLPFIIRFLMQMKSSQDMNFNNYAFQGCVNEILIRKYEQSWPVCGFKYKRRVNETSRVSAAPMNENSLTHDCSIPMEMSSDTEKPSKNGNATQFICKMHMSPDVKKRKYKLSRNKPAKPHCYIDLSIAQAAQQDHKDEQQKLLQFQIDVIGPEANKTV